MPTAVVLTHETELWQPVRVLRQAEVLGLSPGFFKAPTDVKKTESLVRVETIFNRWTLQNSENRFELGKVWVEPRRKKLHAAWELRDAADEHLLSTAGDTETAVVPSSWLVEISDDFTRGAQELLSLVDLDMKSLLLTLRFRFVQDEIYSSIGDRILISMNPYRELSELVSEEMFDKYRKASRQEDIGKLPPHPFRLAQGALLKLRDSPGEECFIISGESGAGKTEVTKLLIRYFAGGDAERDRVLLSTNPILESIGNSKTCRNDNSSRFGKFISLCYKREEEVTLCHCRMDTYLLEKCRVTAGSRGENFHVFYQMVRALIVGDLIATPKEFDEVVSALRKYNKKGIFECRLLGKVVLSLSYVCMQGENDFVMFMEAFAGQGRLDLLIDFTKVLVACILLAELEITETDEGGAVLVDSRSNHKAAVEFAACVGLPETSKGPFAFLDRFICWKDLFDPEKSRTISVPRTASESVIVRDSTVRNLYSVSFDNIAVQLNRDLVCSNAAGTCSGSLSTTIGLLDIYGFEVFGEANGFEQLCINYANERLQAHFANLVLIREQEIYDSEGVDWSRIEFSNNVPVVSLFEQKSAGLWSLIDTECRMPAGSDDNLCRALQRAGGPSMIASKPKSPFLLDSHFNICHYAGTVSYSCADFVVKNKDVGAADARELFSSCSLPLLAELGDNLVAGPMESSPTGRRRQRSMYSDSVSKVFRTQLERIMARLNTSGSFFIRCVKPNTRKSPMLIHAAELQRQLAAGGVLETIKIRQEGFPVRKGLRAFESELFAFFSYGDVRESLEKLFPGREGCGWKVGRTLVFLKADVQQSLTEIKEKRFAECAVVVQAAWRGRRARVALHHRRVAVVNIQSVARGFLTRLKFKETRRVVREAAIVLQKYFRGHIVRKEVRKVRAACTIQRHLRAWLEISRFRQKRKRISEAAFRVVTQWVRRYIYEMRKIADEDHIQLNEQIDDCKDRSDSPAHMSIAEEIMRRRNLMSESYSLETFETPTPWESAEAEDKMSLIVQSLDSIRRRLDEIEIREEKVKHIPCGPVERSLARSLRRRSIRALDSARGFSSDNEWVVRLMMTVEESQKRYEEHMTN